MYAPRFPKSQTEGWFVLLCKEDRDEVLAIKRVNWEANASGKVSTKTTIKLPGEEIGDLLRSGGQGRKVDIWIASDGYVGMVYKIKSVEIPDPPQVDRHIDGLAKGKEGGGLDVGAAVSKGF